MVPSFSPISALIARLEAGLETPDDALIALMAEAVRFVDCFAGPLSEPPAAECSVFEFEGEGDVDPADFAAFEANFSG